MAISVSDIKIYKTTDGLGGAITATESVSGVTGNVFDTFAGAETSAGGTFYACLYIKNEHPTLTAQNVTIFVDSETSHAGVNGSLAKGAAGLDGTESVIADENTAPTGVTFGDTDTTTTGEATADDIITLPDIPAASIHPIWLRIVIDAGTAAKTGYLINTKINFDTAE